MFRTGLDHSEILQRDTQALNLEMTMPTTQLECNKMLRETKSEIKQIVSTSYQRRDQERDAQIHQLDSYSYEPCRSHARNVIATPQKERKSKTARSSRKIKAAKERGQRQGVTRLEIPKDPSTDPKSCTDWQTAIDVPSEIVEQLQRRNRQHFGQAYGTPFAINPLAYDLGFCGESKNADSLLTGEYHSLHLSEPVRLLIQHLQFTHEMETATTFPTVSLKECLECISDIIRIFLRNINIPMSFLLIPPCGRTMQIDRHTNNCSILKPNTTICNNPL